MENDSFIDIPSPQGITPIYSQRNMKIYSITENELNNLLIYEKHQTMYSSIKSGSLSIAFTLMTSALYTGWNNIDVFAKAITLVGSVTSILFAIIYQCMSRNENKTKYKVIETIKSESNTR